MRKLLLVSYVIAVLFFAWGYSMVRFQIFPWKYVAAVENDIMAFIKGADGEETKVTDKIINDLNIRPSRQLYEYQETVGRPYNLLDLKNIKSRRLQPKIFSSEHQTPGYRFIYGTFDYEDSLHAGILLDENNNLVHRWIVDQDKLQDLVDKQNQKDGQNRKLKSPNRRLPQGLEVLSNGSLILNEGKRGNGMHHLDLCGNIIWSALGSYHHVVDIDEDNKTIWTFGPGDMVELDQLTGKVIREISLIDIHNSNPDISIFTPRRRVSSGFWLDDPIHKNDIESLSTELAKSFPKFIAGDLLVTHRSTNTIFVFNPDTLEVKWWRSGIVRRPHDADWQPDGTISVYDNNMREATDGNDGKLPETNYTRYSKIVSIDPNTYEWWITYNGENDNFYSGARGMHEILPNKNIIFSSPYQGRILEVNPKGETVFEFLNTYDEKEMLIVSEVRWFPIDYFDFDISDKSICQ